MTRARLKTEVWDVWRYTSNEGARPLWVLNCTDIVDGQLVLRVGARPIKMGDWLVRDTASAVPQRESHANFLRDYELVP